MSLQHAYCRYMPDLAAGLFNENRPLLEGGLAHTTAPEGSILAFATAPGKVALDYDPGGHGAWTSELLECFEKPGLNLAAAFQLARVGVRARTAGKQTPWEETSLEVDFTFRPPRDRHGSVQSVRNDGRLERQPAVFLPSAQSTTRASPILWHTGPSEPLSALWGWACVRCGLSMRIYSTSVRLMIWRVGNARTW